ncbi:MAG: DUF4250 domain-containing protein [Clostridium sp.]|nr:DUF4250 domain-containing protein [Clostridium sp.]
MPELPEDPAMLLSFVNMHLRDDFDNSLEKLCDDWNVDRGEFLARMAKAGWEWNPGARRFW